MITTPRIFLDSDVVISSLISEKGAAYLLINTPSLRLFISNISKKELQDVTKRLQINQRSLRETIKTNVETTYINVAVTSLKTQYKNYVTDPDDAHIIAGADKSQAKFLVTYNLKHYHIDKIKQDLNIIVLTPANLLQYLRSL